MNGQNRETQKKEKKKKKENASGFKQLILIAEGINPITPN